MHGSHTDDEATEVTPPTCIKEDRLGDVLRRYRFYLAFENTCEPGYVTEKVYRLRQINIEIVFAKILK